MVSFEILRFDGYFKEIVQQSFDECYRIRPVTISYFLEDDTISIYENPYENSSLVQVKFHRLIKRKIGCFTQGRRVRRHRLVKNNQNEFYTWKDLNIGENILIYGINYRICDCDAFTRVNFQLNDREEQRQNLSIGLVRERRDRSSMSRIDSNRSACRTINFEI